MSDAYKPLRFLLAILVGATVVTAISRGLAPKDKIPWRTDVAAAGVEARQAGKPVLLYFTASWCGPCQRMKRTTWGDATVDARLRSAYVPVKVDIDADPATAQTYQISSVPTIVVLDADGNVEQQTAGALPADEFLAWLGGPGPL